MYLLFLVNVTIFMTFPYREKIWNNKTTNRFNRNSKEVYELSRFIFWKQVQSSKVPRMVHSVNSSPRRKQNEFNWHEGSRNKRQKFCQQCSLLIRGSDNDNVDDIRWNVASKKEKKCVISLSFYVSLLYLSSSFLFSPFCLVFWLSVMLMPQFYGGLLYFISCSKSNIIKRSTERSDQILGYSYKVVRGFMPWDYIYARQHQDRHLALIFRSILFFPKISVGFYLHSILPPFHVLLYFFPSNIYLF